MGSLLQDVQYGLRTLRKNPGFTAVAILTLALGIGANTAIFSLVDAFLLRPLPVKDPQQITTLAYQLKGGQLINIFSVPDYRDIREQTGNVFSGVITYQIGLDGLSVNGKANRIVTSYVAGDFFSTLGIKPALGRFIFSSEEETNPAPVLVLGHSYWMTRFGGDPAIVGTKVLINGHPMTVVGVAPEGFHGLFPLGEIQGYLPLGLGAAVAGNPSDFTTNRGLRNYYVLARLRPGVSMKQAQASLDVVAQRLSQENPKDDKDLSLQVFPELRSRPNPDPKNTLIVISTLFLGLSSLVLLLACVNVGNILLVRATVREREMAIRAALGAGRTRLIRQLLTESVLLAVCGGLAGVALGYWGSSSLAHMNLGTDLPVRLDFGFDWRVFGFAFGAALLTGIIVGIVPAIRASRGNLAQILHEGGRGLVGGAAPSAQCTGGGTSSRFLDATDHRRAFHAEPGRSAENEPGLRSESCCEFRDGSQRDWLQRSAGPRILQGPAGSRARASGRGLGEHGEFHSAGLLQQRRHRRWWKATKCQRASRRPFLSTTRFLPTISRRWIFRCCRGVCSPTPTIRTRSSSASSNQAMAKKYWPNQDPIGRHFKIGADPNHSIVVVGVAKDSRYAGMTGEIQPYFYVPILQHYAANTLAALQVRTAAAPESMIPEVERVIQSMAPDMPVFDVKTMTEALNTLNGLLIFQIGAVLAAAAGNARIDPRTRGRLWRDLICSQPENA